MVEEDIM